MPPPSITAKCWSVFDLEKGSFVHGKREYMRNEVASLTKIMTAYTVIKLLKYFKMDPTKTSFKISGTAANTCPGTTANLKEADLMTID